MGGGENQERLYDVVIVGGGPAGLTAALYLARACYRVLVLEKEKFGGQITITSEIVNYPGVKRTSGTELTGTMRQQAEAFGAEFLLAEAVGLELSGDVKQVITERGRYSCFGVLIASGAHPRTIGFPGESEFRGRGVAYCATCDGEFFRGKEIFVIGGGFAAAEESVFLTKYASHVTILIREEDFTCAEAVAKPAREHEKITVLTETVVVEVSGDSLLRSIRYRNLRTGEETVYESGEETFGVFVFAGYAPETEWLNGMVELDSQGYIRTETNQKTSREGVYAAGDVCIKNLRQVVTAVGDGAVAATELEKYAAEMEKKTGLRPRKPVPGKEQTETAEDGFFSGEIQAQLQTVFQKMEQPLRLCLSLDKRPVSQELSRYMEKLSALTDRISLEKEEGGGEGLPVVRIRRENGEDTGLAFHGVPGGHEFHSFVLGLYNAAGPGQPLEPELRRRIKKLQEPVRIEIFVSLSCTMCPDLVIAAQQIAALNQNVTAEVYDLNHFPELKDRYQVMSVPCMVMNDSEVHFGKKSMVQILELLERRSQ